MGTIFIIGFALCIGAIAYDMHQTEEEEKQKRKYKRFY